MDLLKITNLMLLFACVNISGILNWEKTAEQRKPSWPARVLLFDFSQSNAEQKGEAQRLREFCSLTLITVRP
jgi:hypothetical protein